MAEWLIAAAGVVTAIGILWKPVRKLAHLLRALSQFIEDWHGVPEEYDKTGRVIRPARRGAASIIEEVRSQVQNSHRTNLRDDLDRLHAEVFDMKQDLREHIEIAKDQERRRDEIEEQLASDIGVLRERYAPPQSE